MCYILITFIKVKVGIFLIYSFQLCPHANIRYQESLVDLGKKELECLLLSLGIPGSPEITSIGGSTFFRLQTDEKLSDDMLHLLRQHSSLLLISEEIGGLLRPLPFSSVDYLPADLPEVLKYKGKTSARFTQMMINCALAASSQLGKKNLKVLDPLCGRGTTLYCALQHGMDAVGIEAKSQDLEEMDHYLSRYCEMHRLKHKRESASHTVGKKAVSCVTFTLSDTKEHYLQGDTRQIQFFHGDTTLCQPLLRKSPASILVTDLPYGVQHAPGAAGGIPSFDAFLRRVLPAWHDAIRVGGAVAMSINTLTLKKDHVLAMLKESGFVPLTSNPYDNFMHDVEQAVRRDFVVALRHE